MGPVVILERSSEEKGELREMSERGRETCFRCFLERGKMSLGMKMLHRSRRIGTGDEHDDSQLEWDISFQGDSIEGIRRDVL